MILETFDSSGAIRGVDDSNGLPTKLTGRNVQESTYFNALAIADTSNHDSSSPPYKDVTALSGKKMLIVYNSTDQPVKVNLLVSPVSGTGALNANATSISVTAGKSVTITSADIRELGEPVNRMGVRLKCDIAPTTGSVTVWLEGVQA